MHMLTVMIVGLAVGTTVTIGQAIGGKNKKQASPFIIIWRRLFLCNDLS